MSVSTRVRAVVVGGAVVAAVLGQGLPAQASVTIKGLCGPPAVWSPKAVSVAKGAKVIWKAVGCTHTVSAYSPNWAKNTTIAAGQTTSRIFRTKGVFKFRCKIHSSLVNGVCSGMCGKVTVT